MEEDNYNNYRDRLLKESNLKDGDLVEYISIDYDFNYTSTLYGKFFYTIKGKPKVKSGKRVYNWCTQWKNLDTLCEPVYTECQELRWEIVFDRIKSQ